MRADPDVQSLIRLARRYKLKLDQEVVLASGKGDVMETIRLARFATILKTVIRLFEELLKIKEMNQDLIIEIAKAIAPAIIQKYCNYDPEFAENLDSKTEEQRNFIADEVTLMAHKIGIKLTNSLRTLGNSGPIENGRS